MCRKFLLLICLFSQTNVFAHPLFMCSRYLKSTSEKKPLISDRESSYGSTSSLEDVSLSSTHTGTARSSCVQKVAPLSGVTMMLGVYYMGFDQTLGITTVSVGAVSLIGALCFEKCRDSVENEDDLAEQSV